MGWGKLIQGQRFDSNKETSRRGLDREHPVPYEKNYKIRVRGLGKASGGFQKSALKGWVTFQ